MDTNQELSQKIVDEIEEIVDVNQLINDDDTLRFAGLNDSVCTYDEGYIRQELFSCLTCYEAKKEVAGVCFACANECHEGHELVELYTKRLFTCDCGNEKFESKCKLQEEKKPNNQYNKYSDNFSNKWCSCKLPYPAEEGTPEASAEMVQCSVCEDWYHNIHLENCDPEAEEMICKTCVSRLPFLMAYENFAIEERPSEGCLISARKDLIKQTPKDLFFAKAKEFRDGLCKCSECEKLYDAGECGFLTDYDESAVKYNNDRDRDADVELKRDPIDDISKIVKNNLGTEAAVLVKNDLDILRNIAKDEIKKLGENTIVTKDHVKRIFERVNEVRAKRPRLDDVQDPDV